VRSWFDSLEQRERLLVSVAVVFVVFAAFWFGLWMPLDRGQEAAASSVDNWKSGISQLRPMKAQVEAVASGGKVVVPQDQSLVVIVDNSLRQRGLYNALQRSQPTPSGDGIRVEFESAAFDDLMLWLGDLHRQYGLDVESGSFSVSTGDSPGRVNSSVTLQR
jgi:general secretion pathway protein M